MKNDRGIFEIVLVVIYAIASPVTFIYLTFFDGFTYNWWNWMIALPLNSILSTLWPVYWIIRFIRSLF